jgi:hypothetical protein
MQVETYAGSALQFVAGGVKDCNLNGMRPTRDVLKQGLFRSAGLTLGLPVEKVLQSVAGGFV